MSTGQGSLSLIAGGDILSWRAVKLDTTTDNQGVAATDASDPIIGITDGSNLVFDTNNHATDGNAIRLQTPHVMRMSASAAIANGAAITATTAGQAVTATSTDVYGVGYAVETAAGAGEVIRILWQPWRDTTGA